MYFGLSEEQQFFQESINKFLEDNVTVDALKAYRTGENKDLTNTVEIEVVDNRAVAIMLGTVARVFTKKNHQEKLSASAEESANMISGLIIENLSRSCFALELEKSGTRS